MGPRDSCRHQSLNEWFHPADVFPGTASVMNLEDTEKAAAAKKSLEYVKDGMVVGLGTGTTATFAIQFLGQQVREGLKIRGIPPSRASAELAQSLEFLSQVSMKWITPTSPLTVPTRLLLVWP